MYYFFLLQVVDAFAKVKSRPCCKRNSECFHINILFNNVLFGDGYYGIISDFRLLTHPFGLVCFGQCDCRTHLRLPAGVDSVQFPCQPWASLLML